MKSQLPFIHIHHLSHTIENGLLFDDLSLSFRFQKSEWLGANGIGQSSFLNSSPTNFSLFRLFR